MRSADKAIAMGYFIALAVTVLIVIGAIVYVVRAKKKGKKCIGCPDGCCPSANKTDTSSCSCCCGCGGEDKNQ